MSRVAVLSIACALTVAVPGCKRVPVATETRASGQSGLMDESFAAKNACNPKNHQRPFIIEWDATDMSSFESHANSDIVVVRYEGCDLTVLDECRDDSIRGSQGAYRPVEWTAGSLEKLNIQSQGELYAKLPLGAASLGGRVAGGEKFSMEYYVAGTRNATRDAVYRGDLEKNPGCEGATHFVYGYNLGAFALGSVTDFNAEAGGSLYGFGAGGKHSSSRQADKKGGDLGVCKSDTAAEVAGCKAPIRLTLRAIRDGENPDRAAMTSTDDQDALNAAGKVDARVKMSEEARAYFESAVAKQQARDGKGCLDELDKFDRADPNHKSTDPRSFMSSTRGYCLMLGGKCDVGKSNLRKSIETQSPNMDPDQLDKQVEMYAKMYCQGKMSPRDQLLQAVFNVEQAGGSVKKTPQFCADNHAVIKKLQGQVKPKDDEDYDVINIPRLLETGVANCFARAGDCKQAWSVYLQYRKPGEGLDGPAQARVDLDLFRSLVQKCKSYTP